MHLPAAAETTETVFAQKPGTARTARWLADIVGTVAAAVPLAFLAALVCALIFASAARAQTPACGGTDIVEDWRRTGSPALARVEREAAAIPNGEGLFWRIEKPGVSPSYLLGTMHVTDPRVLAMPKGAAEAFATSKTVIVESDEILDENRAAAALLARPDLTMFTDGRTIDDFLTPESRKTLSDGLKARGIPLPLVARMKPWMIASFVSLPACEMSRKAAGASFLDKKLAEDAVRQGKTLKGLETLVEQLQVMDALPAAFHVESLVETLALGPVVEDVMATTTNLYLEGRTGMIMPMMKAVSEQHSKGEPADAADFEARIITDRNRTMTTRAAPLLAAGNAFMAIGALHLPGRDGVIELLRKEGYTVSAVR